MSTYEVTTGGLVFQVIADDDVDALSQGTDAGLLIDGDEGGIEELADPDVEDFEPEGPG